MVPRRSQLGLPEQCSARIRQWAKFRIPNATRLTRSLTASVGPF